MKDKGFGTLITPAISVLALLAILFATGCVGWVKETVKKGDEQIEDFDTCVSAGYPVMESCPRQCRTPEGQVFIEDLTPALCLSGRGHWNECSSRCRIEHSSEEEIVCPAVCDALCECGGIAGLSCPAGYECRMPAGIADAMGYCVPSGSGSHLSGEGAYDLASRSDCMGAGRLNGTPYYNPKTMTWWIDLQPFEEKPLCHPACVVHEDTGEVEINWRCTGLLPPQSTS
ncbi:MAG: hypothetical protein QHG99_08045 [Methanomicrobiales archaeon]|nr:hypothetical protein [Methanomicrobiales archaeon]